MNRFALTAAILLGSLALAPSQSSAAACAEGVYRAGCAGPNGAVAVQKAPPPAYRHPPATVTCARGVYRAGCVGPNGAVVRR